MEEKAKATYYVIWSNEHNAWWGPDERGYQQRFHKAGLYTRERALEICRESIPDAARRGMIAEIPVRYWDVHEFLKDQMISEDI